MPKVPDLEKQIWRRIEKIENSVKRAVVKNYKEALNTIRADMSKLYEKYSTDGALTYAEMSKYDRLKKLEARVSKELGTAFNKASRQFDKVQTLSYEAAFFNYRWAMEQDLGLSINWGLLRPQTIERAVMNPLKKIAEDRLWMLGRDRVRREITQGLIRGDSYPQMMRSIADAIKGNAQDALRIVRTEGQRAAVLGQQDQAEEARALGIDVKMIWDATLDGATRPAHGRMDGKVAEDTDGSGHYQFYSPDVGWIDGPLQSGRPSFDINCRCRVREQLAEEQPKIRNVDGEIEGYITYDDWQKRSGN